MKENPYEFTVEAIDYDDMPDNVRSAFDRKVYEVIALYIRNVVPSSQASPSGGPVPAVKMPDLPHPNCQAWYVGQGDDVIYSVALRHLGTGTCKVIDRLGNTRTDWAVPAWNKRQDIPGPDAKQSTPAPIAQIDELDPAACFDDGRMIGRDGS